jgi:membrane-associated protease RseP (regulator of RpoE activity)
MADAPPVETGKAVRGAIIAAVALALIIALRPSAWVTIAIVVGLILTIMLHEFGHFLMAKRAGMKVTEFFLGFGPRIWSFRRGETEYGIKAIPAGGYVRIVGMNNLEEVDPEDEPRTYRQASYAHKMQVVLAGVTVNLLIFVLLLFAAFAVRGQDVATTTIAGIATDSPAHQAGFEAGDRIVSVDGHPIDEWSRLGDYVRPHPGETLAVTLERDGVQRTVDVKPENVDGVGILGVTSRIGTKHFTVPEAAVESVTWIWKGTEAVGDALGRVFSPSGVTKYTRTVANPDAKNGISSADRPRSVIGIVADGSDIVQGDIWNLLGLLASINLFLALVNVLPLPPLDGGHAAVATYEAIASKVRRRRVQVDYRKIMPVAAATLAVLLVFGLSAMYLDIRGL